MSSPLAPETPLLTLAAVRRMRHELEEDERLFAALPARIEHRRRMLDAAMMFVPAGADLSGTSAPPLGDIGEEKSHSSPVVLGSHEEEEGEGDEVHEEQESGVKNTRMTWGSEMLKVLAAATDGLTHKQLLEELVKTPLGARRSEGDKGFYKALSKHKATGQIIQSGAMIYSKTLAAELIAEHGELPAVEVRVEGGTKALILKALEDHPNGMTTQELRAHVGRMEGAPKSILQHDHFIHNSIKGLRDDGLIIKDADLYLLNSKSVIQKGGAELGAQNEQSR